MDATVIDDKETKPVQMRLRKDTLEQVQQLQELTRIQNRTRIVTTAIDLTNKLFSKIKKGSKIVIENPDGTKETITIIGL